MNTYKIEAGRVHELPFTASTSLDPLLKVEASVATLQRRRVEIRRVLGMDRADFGWMAPVSLGRLGSFGIVPTLVLLCLQAVSGWGKGQTLRTMEKPLTVRVIPQFVGSPRANLNQLMVREVREKVLERIQGSGQSIACLVNHAIRDVTLENPEFRAAAMNYSVAMDNFVQEVPSLNRLSGEVIRVEGPEALVMVNRPEGKELRWVDATVMELNGLDEPGAPFVLFEQHWSHDRRSSYFQPAVMDEELTEAERSEIEERVRIAEVPLRDLNVAVY